MVKTLTSKFKVETVWPELVNKRIHRIDSYLKEIQFLNQDGSLVAKGSFKRQIKYIDSNGKFRKTEDRLQFEVVVGSELPEPLPFFTSELKADYYIFQPRRLGENHALLEQGFTLIVSELEAVNQPYRSFKISTDLVTAKGKGETVCSLPVNLKRDSKPKKFDGRLVFDRVKPPVVTGKVFGVVIYRNSHNILKEQEVNLSFSFLINAEPKASTGELVVNGSIAAVDWVLPSYGQGWKMELKLNYNWELVVCQELTVLGVPGDTTHPGTMIKADILVKEEFFQFPQIFKVAGEAGPFEVEPEIKRSNWKRIGSALSISAGISFELYLPDASGTEKNRSLYFECEELVEHFFENIEDVPNLNLKCKLDLDLQKIGYQHGFFLIEVILRVTVKMYRAQVVSLAQDNATTEINGLVPASEINFAFLTENKLNLSHPSLKIIKVRNELVQIDPSLKKGWLNLDGLSEVTVVYLDRLKQYREETFRLNFNKNYYWEAVKDGQDYQIDFSPKLEYDSFRLEGNQLLYKYLWNFFITAFVKRRVLVTLAGREKSQPPMTFTELKPVNAVEEFSIQGEVMLEFSNAREIATSRALITKFNWRKALNAILVEGRINGEIEYWDGEGYLRKEKLELAFWTFLNQLRPIEGEPTLIPRLRSFRYSPLNPWPWRKGAIHYEMDIEINQNPNEGD